MATATATSPASTPRATRTRKVTPAAPAAVEAAPVVVESTPAKAPVRRRATAAKAVPAPVAEAKPTPAPVAEAKPTRTRTRKVPAAPVETVETTDQRVSPTPDKVKAHPMALFYLTTRDGQKFTRDFEWFETQDGLTSFINDCTQFLEKNPPVGGSVIMIPCVDTAKMTLADHVTVHGADKAKDSGYVSEVASMLELIYSVPNVVLDKPVKVKRAEPVAEVEPPKAPVVRKTRAKSAAAKAIVDEPDLPIKAKTFKGRKPAAKG